MPFESETSAVVFTNPAATSGGDHIGLLTNLINNTPPRHEIYGCISHFSDVGVANALIAARKRGVAVRLIVRNDNEQILSLFSRSEGDSHISVTSAAGCLAIASIPSCSCSPARRWARCGRCAP